MKHDKRSISEINSEIDKVEYFLLDVYIYELDKLIGKLEKLLQLMELMEDVQ